MADQRKASDVLLEIEKTVKTILTTVQANDLTQKILANKLSKVIEQLGGGKNFSAQKSPVMVEAADVGPLKPPMHDFDPERHTIVHASQTLSDMQGQTPPAKNQGGRRTSRPEKKESAPVHLEGDDAFLNKAPRKEPESPFPVQIPHGDKAEIIVPNQPGQNKIAPPPQKQEEVVFPDHQGQEENLGKTTIVSQRVMDKNKKIAFMADVRIVNHQTSEIAFSGRTSAIGKWAAPLSMGNYRVSISKRDPGNNKNIEAFQDIIVNGSQDRMDLEPFMMKELDLNKLSKGK